MKKFKIVVKLHFFCVNFWRACKNAKTRANFESSGVGFGSPRVQKAQMHAKNAKCTHETSLKTRENCFFEKILQKIAKLIKKCAMILASEILGFAKSSPKRHKKAFQTLIFL